MTPRPWCLGRSRRRRWPPPLRLPSRVRRGGDTRVRRPFRWLPAAPAAPAAPGASEKGPGKSSSDGVPPLLQVEGCMSAHSRHWQAIGADSWVLSILRDGYCIPFKDSPLPLARTPITFPTYRVGSPRALALRQEVEKMLFKDALEIVLDPGPGFYSRLFLEEKVMGGWHPLIDLSHLNEFVLQSLFRMETAAPVLLSVQEGDFLASIDLKDTYFQISVHQSSRKLLRFLSGGGGGGGGQSISSRPCALDCRLSLKSSLRCLQQSLCGCTPMGFVFSGTWTTVWSLPLRRRRPKRTSRICSCFVTPSG